MAKIMTAEDEHNAIITHAVLSFWIIMSGIIYTLAVLA